MRCGVALAFAASFIVIFAAGYEAKAATPAEATEAKWRPELKEEAPNRSLRFQSGVTKSTGGQNFMDSLMGMLIGWVLLPFSFALLMVNEQNHARMSSLIDDAKATVKETSSTELDHQLDWELVSTSGTTTTSSTLSDSDFANDGNVRPKPAVTNSVKLNRQLEIYQNVEKQKSEGDGADRRTTYWVEKKWCSSFEDSSDWQDQNKSQANPPLPEFAKNDGFDKTWYADKVDMGAFEIPRGLIEKVDNWENIGDKDAQGETWCYLAGRKDAPQVGDVRIKWRKCPCGPTSVVAIQDDNGSFKPYRIISRLFVCSRSAEIEALRNAASLSDADYEASLACPIPFVCCLCNVASMFLHSFSKAEVYFIKAGVAQGAAASLSELASKEGQMAIVCRLTGWILMFASVMMIANPLVKAIAFIPFIGPFFASLLHMTIWLVALVMTLLLSAVIIGIAYVLVRPLLTLTLATVVCGVLMLGSQPASAAA